MVDFFKIEKIKCVILSIILIVLGLLFCFLPIKFLNILEIIVCVVFILYAIFLIMGYCFSPKYLQEALMLFEGTIFLVFGILIILVPDFFVFMLGLIICFYGIKRIIASKTLRVLGKKNWWVDTVIGTVFLILGILVSVLCKTKVVQSAVSILLGITLVCGGICYLFLIFALHRSFKKAKMTVEDSFNQVNEGDDTNKLDEDKSSSENKDNNETEITDYTIK